MIISYHQVAHFRNNSWKAVANGSLPSVRELSLGISWHLLALRPYHDAASLWSAVQAPWQFWALNCQGYEAMNQHFEACGKTFISSFSHSFLHIHSSPSNSLTGASCLFALHPPLQSWCTCPLSVPTTSDVKWFIAKLTWWLVSMTPALNESKRVQNRTLSTWPPINWPTLYNSACFMEWVSQASKAKADESDWFSWFHHAASFIQNATRCWEISAGHQSTDCSSQSRHGKVRKNRLQNLMAHKLVCKGKAGNRHENNTHWKHVSVGERSIYRNMTGCNI